jgi:hypothetical protein
MVVVAADAAGAAAVGERRQGEVRVFRELEKEKKSKSRGK